MELQFIEKKLILNEKTKKKQKYLGISYVGIINNEYHTLVCALK